MSSNKIRVTGVLKSVESAKRAGGHVKSKLRAGLDTYISRVEGLFLIY